MIRVNNIIDKKIPEDIYSKKFEKKNWYGYFHLKLPTEKITKESENIINEKVKQNAIKPKFDIATIKDAQRISKIYNLAWLSSGEPFRNLNENDIEVLFKDPKCNILIAKVFGIDVGFIITYLEGEDDEYGIIAGLGVIPRFQRKGIASALALSAWKQFFKNSEVKELRIEIFISNKYSLKFAKSLGFKEYDLKVFIVD